MYPTSRALLSQQDTLLPAPKAPSRGSGPVEMLVLSLLQSSKHVVAPHENEADECAKDTAGCESVLHGMRPFV
jgi:hypothetical protein